MPNEGQHDRKFRAGAQLHGKVTDAADIPKDGRDLVALPQLSTASAGCVEPTERMWGR